MPSQRQFPNHLMVEGDEDKRVIPQFMENFIAWGNKPADWPVLIESYNGIEPLLKAGVIEAKLKTSGLKALGVLVDANSDIQSRWRGIRDRAIGAFPAIPEDLPPGGLVCVNEDGLRFGAWLMPDNRSRGMLETFLSLFIPAGADPLWTLVQEHCRQAKESCGAPYTEAHLDKARIHAWLALQNPPGQQLHIAILTKTLRPGSPQADSFVNWFRTLYEL
jgi:hypothetical protein